MLLKRLASKRCKIAQRNFLLCFPDYPESQPRAILNGNIKQAWDGSGLIGK
jgi:lauroyl/myristoyl acyltransferase